MAVKSFALASLDRRAKVGVIVRAARAEAAENMGREIMTKHTHTHTRMPGPDTALR